MREGEYQSLLKKRIQEAIPGCMVLKNDSSWLQGVPDLTVLYEDKWASLEVKRSKNEAHQPNQDYYVETMSNMSYSAFIYPENEKEILDELQRALGHRGEACLSES